ncbi:hypothetical protein CPB85DRAFT_1324364 [Mucidula mucida]|nr:hypothetical protein CPB85DRAFT_1324364 [Mucidula mucida]
MDPTDATARNPLPSTSQTPRTPRVHHLLRSNYPPCEAELTDFRNDIDQRIDSVKEQAESHLADAKSLIHPIRSLPNEILHEIFTYCVPTRDTYFIPVTVDSLDPRFAPHSWRELVISSPLLWTYFQFNTASHAMINLNLSVVLIDINGRTANHPVLPALKHAMSRCTHILTDASTRCLQALSGTVFSRLTLLAVTRAYVDVHRVQVDTFNSVCAPQLRWMVCHDRRWESLKYVAVPWSQLTRVYKLPLFDDVGLQRLRELPQIKYLRVIILKSCIPPDSDIPFPQLYELDLSEDGKAEPGCIKGLVESLVLEALSSLRLDYRTSRRLLFPDPNKFTSDTLRKLYIKCTMRGHPDNTQNLLEFLSLLPSVTLLALEDNPLDAPLIAGLRYSSTTSVLPHLLVLDISKCATPPNDISALFDMLESRLSIVSDTASSSENPSSRRRVSLRTLYVPLWLYSHEDERWRAIKNRRSVNVVLR